MASHRTIHRHRGVLKPVLAAALPFVVASIPGIRKKYGWGFFSLPSLILLGGTWYLERKFLKTW